MPFTAKPVCASCTTKISGLWRKNTEGKVLCTKCAAIELDGEEASNDGSKSSQSSIGTTAPPGTKSESWTMSPAAASTRLGKDSGLSHLSGPLRKSARIKPSKYKYQPVFKNLPTKGKSRRVIFKKNPIKAPSTVSTVVTSDYIFCEGQYWQTGDIASVMDDDGAVYYVQLRGFLQDQYCDKSAVVTWLLPTTASLPGKFDPATYIIGPEEDLPRPMSCFEFLMHAPSAYFQDKSSPYPTRDEGPPLGYIMTTLGPEVRRLPTRDQIHGLRDLDTDDLQREVKVKVKDAERKRKVTKERKKKAARFIGKKQLDAVAKEKALMKERAAALAAASREKAAHSAAVAAHKETRNRAAAAEGRGAGDCKDSDRDLKSLSMAPRRGRRVKAKKKDS